jgi:hypothetical protein
MKPEVQFILDELATAVTVQPTGHPLVRIDADSSRVYEGDATVANTPDSDITHQREFDLQDANTVTVSTSDLSNQPLGTEYNLGTEVTLSVTLTGLSHEEFGHIDPDGVDGINFDDLGRIVRGELLQNRTYPNHPEFQDAKLDLRVPDETDTSAAYADTYERTYSVLFRGRQRFP